jgi:hypothetical protein
VLARTPLYAENAVQENEGSTQVKTFQVSENLEDLFNNMKNISFSPPHLTLSRDSVDSGFRLDPWVP